MSRGLGVSSGLDCVYWYSVCGSVCRECLDTSVGRVLVSSALLPAVASAIRGCAETGVRNMVRGN